MWEQSLAWEYNILVLYDSEISALKHSNIWRLKTVVEIRERAAGYSVLQQRRHGDILEELSEVPVEKKLAQYKPC